MSARATGCSCARGGRAPWRWRCAHRRAASSSSSRARYSPTTSSSPSPSSLRIAASCWRSRNSRCCLSTPSLTSSRIDCATCSSARWPRAHVIDQLDRVDTSTARNMASRAASSNSAHRATESASAPGSRLRRNRSGRRRERRSSAISSRTARSSRPTFSIDGEGPWIAEDLVLGDVGPALVAVDGDHAGTRLDLDDRNRLTRRQRPHIGNPGEDPELVFVAAGQQQGSPFGGFDGTPELVGRQGNGHDGARQDHRGQVGDGETGTDTRVGHASKGTDTKLD